MLQQESFPELDPVAIASTRDALHGYARVLGSLLKACRKRRKHWWHASLRPSLCGLTTGVVYAAEHFEVELDLVRSQVRVDTSSRGLVSLNLDGQPRNDVANFIFDALASAGVTGIDTRSQERAGGARLSAYSARQAGTMHRALSSIAAALEDFRAGIREETSPIQVWPHHFDLSMIWLPGNRIPGQDPADEEQSDKQMNFGFVFGDEGLQEPYFYVTAYPEPEELPGIALPPPACWHSEGFSGAVLRYRELIEMKDPRDCLLSLWSVLLEAGREHLANDD